MIARTDLQNRLHQLLQTFRAVELVGPRQVGKTTLAREFVAPDSPNYFDLESAAARRRLAEPMAALAPLNGLVVIDEVQHMPALCEVLRVLIDRPTHIQRKGQYLLLGSATPRAMHQSESLLGRAVTLEVTGFNLNEVGAETDAVHRLWLRGGFPEAYLEPDDAVSSTWREAAMQRFLYSDLPQLGMNVPAPTMLRFWQMAAHTHGQTWNAAPLARSLGTSETTVRRYLDHLTQTFMVRQLPPWFEDLGKRQVKAPKMYLRDSGLLHALLGVHTLAQLLAHPLCGASWTGFALEQVLRIAKPDSAWTWSTHAGARLDLLMLKGSQRIGVEFQRADAPKVTPSMRIAQRDLKLDALYVVYPGAHRFALEGGVQAVPLWALLPGDVP
ncbi:ATP-binding protein [Rhodoferax sp. WC2427]|uniref:ATP-binding protein n=1 Tax=Rhodoferax sp. WC2427 TaxID=3234144 RepID=UPI0034654F3E